MPHLLPYIAIAGAFRAFAALSEFDKMYMLTLGGPGSATTTMSLLNYKLGVVAFNIGPRLRHVVDIAAITLVIAAPLIVYLLRSARKTTRRWLMLKRAGITRLVTAGVLI